jgi:hypothetical protein
LIAIPVLERAEQEKTEHAKTKQLCRRILQCSPIIATVLLFATTIALFFFDSPSTDDFLRGSIKLSDLPGYVLNEYLTHSGRWVELTLDVVTFSRNMLPTLYPFYLLALMGAYFASLYFFISRLLGTRVLATQRAAIASVFLVLFITGMNSIGQTIFWASGAVSSVLPVFGMLWLLGLLMSPVTKPTSGIRYSILVFLPLLITGLHEMFAFILCVTLGMGVVVTVATRHPHRNLWIAAFAGAVTGTAVVVVAPGNYVRAADVTTGLPSASWLKIISYGFRLFLSEVLDHWLLDLKLMATTLIFVLHPAIRRLRPVWLSALGAYGKFAVLAGWLITTTVPLILTQVALRSLFVLPGRTLDGIYLVFLLGWFATVFVFTRPAHTGLQDKLPPGKGIYLFASVVLALSLLAAPNSKLMYHDLRSKAGPWKAALGMRTRAIQAAKAENRLDLDVPSLSPFVPESFFYEDVLANPKDWRNRHVAQYYGFRTIVSH